MEKVGENDIKKLEQRWECFQGDVPNCFQLAKLLGIIKIDEPPTLGIIYLNYEGN